MTEEQARKAKPKASEFPETLEILAKVRAALAEQVFLTPVNASAVREDLYTRVQAIDALMGK
jgi:Trp operon repressor